MARLSVRWLSPSSRPANCNPLLVLRMDHSSLVRSTPLYFRRTMYEYKNIYVQDYREIEDEVNQAAANGFRVISVTFPSGRYVILMEREVPLPSPTSSPASKKKT